MTYNHVENMRKEMNVENGVNARCDCDLRMSDEAGALGHWVVAMVAEWAEPERHRDHCHPLVRDWP